MTIPPTYNPGLPFQTVYYDRDVEHLRILSICWYVASGLSALIGFFPLIYVALGIFMITGSAMFKGGHGPPPPPFAGWILVAFGGIFCLVCWIAAVMGFLAARSLPRRRRIVLCYVAAAICCLQIPIGTTLGVFTFVVLSRPSIRASFS